MRLAYRHLIVLAIVHLAVCLFFIWALSWDVHVTFYDPTAIRPPNDDWYDAALFDTWTGYPTP